MGNLNSLQNFFSALFLLLSAELSFCKTQKQLDEEWNARNYPNPTISNDFRRCGMKSKVCFWKVLVLYYFRGSHLVRAVRRRLGGFSLVSVVRRLGQRSLYLDLW